MLTPNSSEQALPELVAFLFSRRETILNKWRAVCEADPALPTISILSREEFNDLMTVILDILEQKLLQTPLSDDPILTGASHGMHRWQKSHSLAALIRELNHMATILAQELLVFGQLYPQADPRLLLHAHLQISELMRETVLGSITKYDELQRLEAAGRVNGLQQALEQTTQLSRLRGDVLRTSSHDLRSGLGIIQSAAYLINLQDISPEERLQYQQMINRNLNNVSALLSQLMDLARLEARQDLLQEEKFNVAQLLKELVASAQPMASERGLLLQADGPESLWVETDRVKIYRIAQNLVINALKYTPAGIVSVSWSAEDKWRWGFSIQDSGPGLPSGLLEVFHQQLKPIDEHPSVLAPEEGQPSLVHPNATHEVPPGSELEAARSDNEDQTSSEGIGLLIVKRLCEVLGASLDIESVKGRGTLFRVRMLVSSIQ